MDMNKLAVFGFVDEIDRMVDEYVEQNFQRVNAEDCGLDPRAAYELYVNRDAIVCDRNAIGRLDYYGGFEYVDKDYCKEIGDYVFFFNDYERVGRAIDTVINKLEQAA